MRLLLILALVLFASPVGTDEPPAAEAAGSGGAAETAGQTPAPAPTAKKSSGGDMRIFVPTEELPAGSAISFPTDI